MKDHNLNTQPLWSALKGLLLLMIGIILSVLVYLPLSDYIVEWGSSKYSKEDISQMNERRADLADSGPAVVDGIHVASGMAYDENFAVVKSTCTSCHSSKLIIQNRATREGWKDMIKWMQETQGLPPLGTLEPQILDYLAKHYAPQKTGRRDNLDMEAIEWYVLKGEE